MWVDVVSFLAGSVVLPTITWPMHTAPQGILGTSGHQGTHLGIAELEDW